MTYACLMVYLELGRSNAGMLQITGDLAERFHASVIGIAAWQPMQIVYGDGFVSGDIYEQDRQDLDKEMKTAEAEFRSALQTRAATLEWRSTVMFTLLSDYLAREARSADLVITGVPSGDLFDSSRSVKTGDLVAFDRQRRNRAVRCRPGPGSRRHRRGCLRVQPPARMGARRSDPRSSAACGLLLALVTLTVALPQSRNAMQEMVLNKLAGAFEWTELADQQPRRRCVGRQSDTAGWCRLSARRNANWHCPTESALQSPRSGL